MGSYPALRERWHGNYTLRAATGIGSAQLYRLCIGFVTWSHLNENGDRYESKQRRYNKLSKVLTIDHQTLLTFSL
jgi:hypothetical protein